jgi:hypothetical protein
MENIEGIDSWSPHTMPKCQMLEMEMPNGKSIIIGFSGIWIITGKLIDNYNRISLDLHRVVGALTLQNHFMVVGVDELLIY